MNILDHIRAAQREGIRVLALYADQVDELLDAVAAAERVAEATPPRLRLVRLDEVLEAANKRAAVLVVPTTGPGVARRARAFAGLTRLRFVVAIALSAADQRIRGAAHRLERDTAPRFTAIDMTTDHQLVGEIDGVTLVEVPTDDQAELAAWRALAPSDTPAARGASPDDRRRWVQQQVSLVPDLQGQVVVLRDLARQHRADIEAALRLLLDATKVLGDDHQPEGDEVAAWSFVDGAELLLRNALREASPDEALCPLSEVCRWLGGRPVLSRREGGER